MNGLARRAYMWGALLVVGMSTSWAMDKPNYWVRGLDANGGVYDAPLSIRALPERYRRFFFDYWSSQLKVAGVFFSLASPREVMDATRTLCHRRSVNGHPMQAWFDVQTGEVDLYHEDWRRRSPIFDDVPTGFALIYSRRLILRPAHYGYDEGFTFQFFNDDNEHETRVLGVATSLPNVESIGFREYTPTCVWLPNKAK